MKQRCNFQPPRCEGGTSRRLIRQEDFVGIAVQPRRTAFERTADRMPRRPVVIAGMPVLGVIATPHLTALSTHTQMDPRVSKLETSLTALR